MREGWFDVIQMYLCELRCERVADVLQACSVEVIANFNSSESMMKRQMRDEELEEN